MKDKKMPLILLIVLVVLIAGASVMYDKLGGQVQSAQLVTNATNASTASEEIDSEPTAAATPQTAPTEAQPTQEVQPKYFFAPNFTVYDIDGNAVQLHEYIGKPIVLNFWASWCGPCQNEMPDFHEKYLEIGSEVHFLMVNMTGGRETLESASRFVSENGYTFPVLYDTQMDAAITYGAYLLPMTYFIDAEGYLVTYAEGEIGAELLQVGLDRIYFPG